MKMAQARENRKDNKGFSLVELIIVIAIMVALVAMLAPQFVKYVAKSRNAVVSSAAEDVLATAKSEFALTHLVFDSSKSTTGSVATITIGKVTPTSGDAEKLAVAFDGLKFTSEEGASEGTNGATSFEAQCGIDSSKKTTSNYQYTIYITNNAGGSPTFEMKLTNS